MIQGKKIVVVLPAYNAAKTLERTYSEIPKDIVDEIILVDDASNDETVAVAQRLNIVTILHKQNTGYGGNQKTCYDEALKRRADIIIMLHPDYQYPPRLISAMAYLIISGEYDVVLGSRILGGKALKGGMPFYKYISNRFLTFIQNLLIGAKLSEYHTGYRAFTREVLTSVKFENNSDDFVFDNELLSQIIYKGFRIGEITCPARYFPDASSINFRRSIRYGMGCLRTALLYRLSKWHLVTPSLFNPN
ncbi:MAG TPA: glycosyltransferase family 2 protein [Bacteroidota bacterium]|nr:glycosyltransferase family 2 protein [Bacteroidota bacterium]